MSVDLSRISGQDEAVQRLRSMLSRGRLPHALLFSGPEGVGKLSAARLLAQVLMCTRPPSGEGERMAACDECSACQKVREQIHADVHLIAPAGDGSKALKVEEVREAIRQLQLRPLEGSVKVSILDGADRMTVSAQNALLKTLEEPPGAAHLILITARPRMLLPTVLSRCQRIPFRPVPAEVIARMIAERRGLPEDRAMLLAAIAQGSLGRALELDPEALIGRRDRVAELDRRLIAGRKNVGFEALELATELGEDRAELGGLLDLLLVWLHDQAFLGSGGDEARATNRDRLGDLSELIEARGLRTVLERTELVLEARRRLDLPFNLNGQMVAEQLCLALAGLARMPPTASAS